MYLNRIEDARIKRNIITRWVNVALELELPFERQHQMEREFPGKLSRTQKIRQS